MKPLTPQEKLEINGKSIIIDEHIHSGYCTQVYHAKDESLGIPVIVKRFTDSGPIQKSAYDASNRYWKEVRAKLCTLLVPDILYCDNNFQLTEYVPGKNLEDCCEALVGISVPYVKKIVEDTLRKIAILVEHGLVHADIKPANLVLLPGNDQSLISTLIDFDFMRPRKENNGGISFGTPWFKSPEQSRGEYSETSDAYSLAITAIELLHGDKRFSLASLGDCTDRRRESWPIQDAKEIIQKQLIQDAPEYRRDIHGLLNFIFACLEWDHQKRPQSAKEMSQILWDTGNITEV